MVEKTKDELKRDKALRITTMINRAIEYLDDLRQDVNEWSTDDDLSPDINIQHQMHQNETCANLIFLVDYLQNKRRS